MPKEYPLRILSCPLYGLFRSAVIWKEKSRG